MNSKPSNPKENSQLLQHAPAGKDDKFHQTVRNLCKQISDCRDEAQSVALTAELRSTLHQRIEDLRATVAADSATAMSKQPKTR